MAIIFSAKIDIVQSSEIAHIPSQAVTCKDTHMNTHPDTHTGTAAHSKRHGVGGTDSDAAEEVAR